MAQHSVTQTICTQFHCCDCNRDFVHNVALLQHLQDKTHRSTSKVSSRKKFPCTRSGCGKSFGSKKARKQHELSPYHNPLCQDLKCIGSAECTKRFNAPSSMILHLESGACASGLTRNSLNEMIALQDATHLITSQTALELIETGTESDSNYENGVILTPSSSSLSLLERRDSTESDWTDMEINTPPSFSPWEIMSTNDEGNFHTRSVLFLCPICPPASNRFSTAKDLENHRLSPVHAQKIYHCPAPPLGRGKGNKNVRKTFSTLSGLAMHVESGSCGDGKRMFSRVLEFVNARLKDLGVGEICSFRVEET